MISLVYACLSCVAFTVISMYLRTKIGKVFQWHENENDASKRTFCTQTFLSLGTKHLLKKKNEHLKQKNFNVPTEKKLLKIILNHI